MALQLKVTDDFIAMTDEMAKALEEKHISFENMNLMVVKVPLADSSAIVTSKGFKELEGYRSGIGRVIAVPRLLNFETDAKVSVGDYVVFSHEAKYPVNSPIINFIFEMAKDFEDEKNPFVCIRDVDIIAVVRPEILHKQRPAA